MMLKFRLIFVEFRNKMFLRLLTINYINSASHKVSESVQNGLQSLAYFTRSLYSFVFEWILHHARPRPSIHLSGIYVVVHQGSPGCSPGGSAISTGLIVTCLRSVRDREFICTDTPM